MDRFPRQGGGFINDRTLPKHPHSHHTLPYQKITGSLTDETVTQIKDFVAQARVLSPFL